MSWSICRVWKRCIDDVFASCSCCAAFVGVLWAVCATWHGDGVSSWGNVYLHSFGWAKGLAATCGFSTRFGSTRRDHGFDLAFRSIIPCLSTASVGSKQSLLLALSSNFGASFYVPSLTRLHPSPSISLADVKVLIDMFDSHAPAVSYDAH